MSASASTKAGLAKSAASASSPKVGVGGQQAVGSIININLAPEEEEEDDNIPKKSISAEAETSYSLADFASSQSQAESASAISQKKLTTQEYTIGGLPYDDWREWAASVKEKPMP